MKKASMLFFVLFLISGANLNAQALQSGNAAYGARHFKDAISHYERALMDNPSDLELNLRLANCYRYTNDMQKAEAKYEWACKSASVQPSAHYYYGTVLMANKKYDQAKEAFGKSFAYNADAAAKGQAACDFAKNNLAKESAFGVNKESISLNDFDDYAPILHQGKVVFTSSRKVDYGNGQFSDPKTQNFLYETTRETNGQLSNLKLIKNPMSAVPTSNITPIAITTNETRGITTMNEFSTGLRHIRNASLGKLDMEIAMNMKSINDFPIGDVFAFLKNRPASFPEFTNNGNTLYFAADGLDGGFGGFDIWVTHFQNNQWTAPQNLGPNVNTYGDEICPNIANNGDLHFASDAHKGFGGYDVFRARKVGNVWKEVRNLGNQINSSFDDMYFVFDGFTKTAYFSSNRDGSTYNIYSALMKGDESLMPLVNENEVVVAVVDPNLNTNNTNTNTTNTNNTNNTNTNNANSNTTSNGNGNLTQTNTGGYKPTNTTATNTNTTNTANTNNAPPIDGYKNNDPTKNPTYTGNTNKTTTNTTTNTGTKTTTNNNSTVANNTPTSNGSTVPCAMNFYIGGVIDAETQRPLDGAIVYIRNVKTKVENKVKDPTNVYGEYSVILDPLNDYTVAISKAGYKDLIFDVNTGNGGKKTLLGTRPLYAAATLERDKFGNVIQAQGTVVSTTPTDEELLNPTKSTGKTFSYESNGAKLPKNGYLIQAIMATTLTPTERAELAQYGNIMTEPRGNKTVYRVGIFVDNEHLEKSLVAIKKTYKDAFKVAVELDNDNLSGRIALSAQVIYPPVSVKPTPVPVIEDKTPVVVQTTPVLEKQNTSWTNKETYPEDVAARGTKTSNEQTVAFKVQLGAFQQPEGISFKNISSLGTIEQTKKSNGLTYFYLAGFKTIEDARIARTKAQENGVASPFIVAFKNGVQVNISDVVN